MEIAVGLAIGLLVGITTTAYMMKNDKEKSRTRLRDLAKVAIGNREKIIDKRNEQLREIKRIVEEPDLGSTINLKNKIKSVLDESSKSI